MVKKNTSTTQVKRIRKSSKPQLLTALPWIYVGAGIVGLIAATILIIEKIQILKNPNAVLSCDLNPIIACGSVINTPQASVFGFPNPVLGLIGFGALLTVGLALLAAATFKRWFWVLIQLGTTFGIGFVTWLQYQSIYEIGALCPYCMVVWAVMIPVFVYTTAYNIRQRIISFPRKLSFVGRLIAQYPHEIIFAWYLIVLMLILEHFWYYWSTLL